MSIDAACFLSGLAWQQVPGAGRLQVPAPQCQHVGRAALGMNSPTSSPNSFSPHEFLEMCSHFLSPVGNFVWKNWVAKWVETIWVNTTTEKSHSSSCSYPSFQRILYQYPVGVPPSRWASPLPSAPFHIFSAMAALFLASALCAHGPLSCSVCYAEFIPLLNFLLSL